VCSKVITYKLYQQGCKRIVDKNILSKRVRSPLSISWRVITEKLMAKTVDTTDRETRINASRLKLYKKPQLKWQERLLPTMNGLLIGLTIFFFLTTFGQMAYLHWSILQIPEVNIDPSSGATLSASAETFKDRENARELEVRSRMEAFIVTQRYHQVSVLLMSGLWIRYLGFMTGMILALVGASFDFGKLREPTQKLQGKFSGIDLSLRTTSPGVILAVLGVILMFATILDKDFYNVSDSNVYLFPVQSVPTTANLSLPVLMPPEQVFGTAMPTP